MASAARESVAKQLLKRLLSERLQVRLRAVDYRWHSAAEFRLISSLCDPHKCSIDIGANLGVLTYVLARYSSHVYAYEPNPELADKLRLAFRKKVTVIQAALSDMAGSVTLRVPTFGGLEVHALASVSQAFVDADKIREFKVPRLSLDDEDLSNVGFVKIDVEQHEESVLRGAMKLLESQKPNIFLEVTPKLYSRPLTEFLGTILGLGYHGYFLYEGILLNLNDYRMDKHNCGKNYGIPGRYVTNVVLSRTRLTP